MSLVTVYKSYIKNYWKSLQNQWGEIEEKKRMAITKAFVLHSSTKLKHLLTIIWKFFTDYSLSGVTNQFNIKISFVCWVSTIQQLFHTKEFKNSLQKKEEERKKEKTSLVQLGATFYNLIQTGITLATLTK